MAIVNRVDKYIFLHIIKTGGTSIRGILSGVEEVSSHVPAKVLKKHLFDNSEGDVWINSFKFSIVRNPYERLISLYFHLKKDTKHTFNFTAKDRNFNQFVRFFHDEMFNRIEVNDWWFFSTQLYDLSDENGKVLVDKTYKVENIYDCVKELHGRFGVKNHVYYLNKSGDRSNLFTVNNAYSPESISLVNEMFAVDFEAFGYDYLLPQVKKAV